MKTAGVKISLSEIFYSSVSKINDIFDLNEEKVIDLKPGHTGLYRLYKASGYSIQGLKAAWKYESAIRQEIIMLLILIPIALLLGQTAVEQSLLIASAVLVLIVELINAAIEAVVDRIGSEYHELSGRAKDIGSCAVLVTLILAASVWSLILLTN